MDNLKSHLLERGHLLWDRWVSVTFIHPVEDLIQVAFSVAALVFLPHGAVFTPQHHELTVPAAVGGKVGDLHNHRAEGTEQIWGGGSVDAGVHAFQAGGQGQREGGGGGAEQSVPAWRGGGPAAQWGPHLCAGANSRTDLCRFPVTHHQAPISLHKAEAQPNNLALEPDP